MKACVRTTILIAVLANRLVAQGRGVPVDRPISASSSSLADSIWVAMQPAVERARASYPEARRRYLAGLASGYTFFVTARLRDSSNRTEQVFMAVDSIRQRRLFGRIASDIQLVQGFRRGQPYSLAEADLIDWMITDPQGSEEGNIVGKFMDEYQDRRHRTSVGLVPFAFAADESRLAILGSVIGRVDVRADSLVVVLDSGTATANKMLDTPIKDVWLRVSLAFRSSSTDDWSIGELSDSVLVSLTLRPSQTVRLSRSRFVLPRPPHPLGAYWLVFTFQAAMASVTGREEFATYLHSNRTIFHGFM
jgi:hypothetical protein